MHIRRITEIYACSVSYALSHLANIIHITSFNCTIYFQKIVQIDDILQICEKIITKHWWSINMYGFYTRSYADNYDLSIMVYFRLLRTAFHVWGKCITLNLIKRLIYFLLFTWMVRNIICAHSVHIVLMLLSSPIQVFYLL